jgi:uncharacterized protein YndB with AHSA1/START domain
MGDPMQHTAQGTSLEVRRHIPASIERVYAAWTDQQVAAQWAWGEQHDNVHVQIDAREGGVWKHTIRNRENGVQWTFHGVYQTLRAPTLVVFTFSWTSDNGDVEGESLVRVELTARGNGTDVYIQHTRLADNKVDGSRLGWESCLNSIEKALR